MSPAGRKFTSLILVFLAVFLSIRYLLPLFFPFLLGAGLALAAEPLVRFLSEKLRLPRAAAAGIGVSMAFSFIALVVMLVCGLLFRELRTLSGILPDLADAARAGLDSLSGWLLSLAQKAPDGLRSMLTQSVTNFFSGGSALLDQIISFLVSLASGILSQVPDSALSLGTGIIASFMISAKLPKLKEGLKKRIPTAKLKSARSTLVHLKATVGSWLKAQLKLSVITFGLVTLGFLILRISYAHLWAFAVALVDAFPILGTGTVLVPWSIAAFLQGDRLLAFGLLGVYAGVSLTRSLLEPRLVGRQLGLDPLVTLVSLYAGYKIWGFGGMILAPLLAAAAMGLAETKPLDGKP